MQTRYSPRLVLMVIALVILISTPIVGLLFPIFYVQTFVYDRSTIVLYPDGMNFRIVMVACVVLLIGFIFPLIRQNKFTYGLLGIFIAAGIFVFYLSILSYTYVGKEQVVLNKLFDKQAIQWSEMDEVILEYYTDDTGIHEEYIFTSHDGNSMRIPLVGQFIRENKNEIYKIAVQNNVQFIEREKK